MCSDCFLIKITYKFSLNCLLHGYDDNNENGVNDEDCKDDDNENDDNGNK